MGKITIEITGIGWKTEYTNNAGVIRTEQFERVKGKRSEYQGNGYSFEEDNDFPEPLYNALNSFMVLDVCEALQALDN